MQHEITRRAMLTGAGTTIAAAALAVPAIAAVQAQPEVCSVAVDPLERFETALADFRAAAVELVPSVNDWVINRTHDAVIVCGLTTGSAHTVIWDGPGLYELLEPTVHGNLRNITREPKFDHGRERWFRISTGFKGPHEPDDWCCPERNLPALRRKVDVIELTAQQRADVHLSDFRRAMEEVDPTITGWGMARHIDTGGLAYVSATRRDDA